jgi:hypothetical protein
MKTLKPPIFRVLSSCFNFRKTWIATSTGFFLSSDGYIRDGIITFTAKSCFAFV